MIAQTSDGNHRDMKARALIIGALAAMAAPLAAQPAELPKWSTPEIEQALDCAAVQTFIAALVAESDSPDPVLEEKLQKSVVRWLDHASKLRPEDEEAVMERYSAKSAALIAPLEAEGFDSSAFGERLGEDAQACLTAERATFGNTVTDL